MTFSHSISSYKEIKLDRHAVIEASAGTGKTYTLECLVVELILKEGVSLEEILLVTFTEKATSELEMRIRRKLADALKGAENNGQHERLKDALDNFDRASIFTIHGFCQQVLQEHAFDSRTPFAHEVVDDAALYRQLLRRHMRTVWPRRFGERLGDLLHFSGYPGWKQKDECEWENKVVNLALRYNREAGVRLVPDFSSEAPLDEILKRIKEVLDRIAEAGGDIDPNDPKRCGLYRNYDRLNVHGRQKGSILAKIIAPLLQCVIKNVQGQFNLGHLQKFFLAAESYTRYCDVGFACLTDVSWNKAGDNRADVCPYLENIVRSLEELKGAWEQSKLYLPVQTAKALREEAFRFKREQGLISYDDMLLLVYLALQDNPGLVAALRGRYRYALVDEFHDTDPIQWEIFKTLFLAGREPNRLILIGDPKQAIYGFRGADVHTYARAREELGQRGDSARYSLGTNWRSTPGLIAALNHLFEEGAWFSASSLAGFEPVKPPEEAERQTRLYRDETGRAAITVVDLGREDSGSRARSRMARFIAKEIKRLLEPAAEAGAVGSRLVIGMGGEIRPLCAGDICIAVRAKHEAVPIEKELSQARIPYSFYKKPGLYESAEALHLDVLLSAIADPADESALAKALLTDFFHVPLERLAEYRDLPPDHPIRTLFRRWNELAEGRRWAKLFQSILEDTSVLLSPGKSTESPDSKEFDPYRDRRITNYQHIVQELLRDAIQMRLDFAGVCEHLGRLRRKTAPRERDEDLHRLETEQPKVQIMTMHTSKGLQFPVVFVAGGFTGGCKDEDYYKFHQDGHIIFDLTKDRRNREAHLRERDQDNRCLFYVAFTRAMHKLYLPKHRQGTKVPEPGSAPAAGFLFDALEEAWPDGKGDANARHVDDRGRSVDQNEQPLQPALDPLSDKTPQESPPPSVALPEPLFPKEDPDFRSRKIEVESFSSLHERLARIGADRLAIAASDTASVEYESEEIPLVDESPELVIEATLQPEEKPLLPPGAETGSMLHDLLEIIDYETVAQATAPEALLAPNTRTFVQIDQALLRYALADPEPLESAEDPRRRCRQETAGLLWNALHTPLTAEGQVFCLGQVKGCDRLHELEFYYPLSFFDASGSMRKGFERLGFDLSEEFFVHGFIDLVFRLKSKDGAHRYFLLDWKSNTLTTGYDPESLNASMADAGYTLQYKLYCLALLRWLKRSVPGFDPERHFGGVFYLYLRGLTGAAESGGVYFDRPGDEDSILKSLSAELAEASEAAS